MIRPQTVRAARKSRKAEQVLRESAGSAEVGRIASPKMTSTRLKVPAAPRKPMMVRKIKTKVAGDSLNAVKSKTKLCKIFDHPYTSLCLTRNSFLLAAQLTPAKATHAHQRRPMDGKTSAPKAITFDNFDEFLKLLRSLLDSFCSRYTTHCYNRTCCPSSRPALIDPSQGAYLRYGPQTSPTSSGVSKSTVKNWLLED